MTKYTRLVISVAIGAATILASALAFAQPSFAQQHRGHRAHGGGMGGGAPAFRQAAPAFRQAAPTFRQAAPVYRPAAPAFRQPAFQQPAFRAPAPVYRQPAYRAPAQVYRPQVFQRPARVQPAPRWRPQPTYRHVYRAPVYQPYPAYPAYPVYPVAPTVWQDYPGEPSYGCDWRKRKVWTPRGLRTKWRRVCY